MSPSARSQGPAYKESLHLDSEDLKLEQLFNAAIQADATNHGEQNEDFSNDDFRICDGLISGSDGLPAQHLRLVKSDVTELNVKPVGEHLNVIDMSNHFQIQQLLNYRHPRRDRGGMVLLNIFTPGASL